MRSLTAAACVCLLALVSAGCQAATRHRILTIFFDGVPPPRSRTAQGSLQGAAQAGVQSVRRSGQGEHGPYAAKLCNACHEAGTTNNLLAPRDEICSRCHELRLDAAYVHGPAASGGCLVCHDPHSSGHPYLLQSESNAFCLKCHDRDSVARVKAHAGAAGECTDCHDAHMSQQKYLLK
jgi:predicted CXXCH cytochrome family protein